jgi:hypothetical protein
VTLQLKPKMDIQKQHSELNEGILLFSSVKDLCADIKYEEYADTTAFPVVLCDDQVSYRVSVLVQCLTVVITVLSVHRNVWYVVE